MTTKKQRRANVAAKRAAFDAAYRADGLAAQKRSRDRQLAQEYEAEKAANKKQAKEIINQMARESAERILQDQATEHEAYFG